MKKPQILIIDDDPAITASVSGLLEDEGYGTLTAQNGKDGLARAKDKDVALVLLDVYMPGMNGLEVLTALKKMAPQVGVVMISGEADIDTAVKATKAGALDFIEKPLQPERLLVSIKNAINMASLRSENIRLSQELRKKQVMIGESEPMKRLWEDIERAAPSKGRVLMATWPRSDSCRVMLGVVMVLLRPVSMVLT